MATGGVKSFDADDFEKRLTALKDTQESIQGMSAWCLQNRAFHKKVVNSWLTVLKQGLIAAAGQWRSMLMSYLFCS